MAPDQPVVAAQRHRRTVDVLPDNMQQGYTQARMESLLFAEWMRQDFRE